MWLFDATQIQTAMKTFEASLDNSLSTNNTTFEKMSSVAEKSFGVVDECEFMTPTSIIYLAVKTI